MIFSSLLSWPYYSFFFKGDSFFRGWRIFIALIIIVMMDSPIGATEFLTPQKVARLVLKNNFNIQIARIDNHSFQLEVPKEQSKYDLNVTWGLTATNDSQEKALVGISFPEEIYTTSGAINQSTRWGTEFELSYAMEDLNYGNVPLSQYGIQLGFSMTQSLGKNFLGLQDRMNDLKVRQQVASFDFQTQYDILKELRNSLCLYWDFVQSQEIVTNQKEILKIVQDFLKLNEDKGEYGASEETDILAAKANVQVKMLELLGRKNVSAKIKENLQESLNERVWEWNLPKQTYHKNQKKAVDQVFQNALSKRLDLKAYLKKLDAKGILVEILKNEIRPAVDLTVSYTPLNRENDFDNALENSLRGKNTETFVGVVVRYAWGDRWAKMSAKQAELEKEKVIYQVAKLRRQINKEVVNAMRDLQVAETSYATLLKLVNIQTEKLKKETKKYETGRSTAKVIIDYQDDLLDTQNLLSKEFGSLQRARVELEFVKNTLLEFLGMND